MTRVTESGIMLDTLYEVMDMVQRLDRKVSALCRVAGIDPAAVDQLPGDIPAGHRDAEVVKTGPLL
jgi:hypothetical protein